MKIRNLCLTTLSVLLFESLLLASSGLAQKALELSISERVTPEQASLLASYGLDPTQIDDFRRLVSNAKGRVEVNLDRTQKIPDFVKAEISFPSEITNPEEQGYYYFDQFMALYRMKDPRAELKPVRVTRGRSENLNVRYLQYYRGIKVVGAEIIVHINPGGKLWFVQGKYVPDIDLSTEPMVARESVLQAAQEDFAAKKGPDIRFTLSPPELAVLNPWVYDRSLENRNILIWMVVLKENLSGREWTYYVDALNGQVLDVLDSARTIDSEIWDRQNTIGTGDDQRWYVDNILQTIPGGTLDPETTNLNTFVTDYWNYLLNRFGVYSINSATSPEGMQLIAHAYFSDPGLLPCPNACWDCISQIAIFCQGMVLRDVVAHELTHGLVEHSGGDLAYRNQSGALNESFSDVFAEFQDCGVGNCTWLHGDGRDVSTPLNRGQQPDHTGNTGNAAFDHPLYHPPCNPSVPNGCNAGNDSGGVHTNSGVPNRVAYLIVNGTGSNDSHYNYRVKGIGLTKAEWLYYSTLIDTGLSNTAEFSDARAVMVTVCDNFSNVGTHDITVNDCCQVRNAWASVGVGSACATLSGPNVWGTYFDVFSPYFVTADATVPSGQTLTFWPDVDVYFFPHMKMTASGTLDLDGTSGPIRLLSNKSNAGMKVSAQLRVENGGQLKFPVKTYPTNDTRPHSITLRDPGVTSSFIRIDENFTISDLNVTLNVNHTRDSDLAIMLESPTGISVVLLSNVGGAGANFTNTTLDDEAATAITAGVAPFIGSFRPQDSLSAFDGQNARGYWRLRLNDGVTGQTGALESWSLTFNQ